MDVSSLSFSSLLFSPSLFTCLLISPALIFDFSWFFPSIPFPVDLLLCSTSQLRPLHPSTSHCSISPPSPLPSSLFFPFLSKLIKDWNWSIKETADERTDFHFFAHWKWHSYSEQNNTAEKGVLSGLRHFSSLNALVSSHINSPK